MRRRCFATLTFVMTVIVVISLVPVPAVGQTA